MTYNTDDTRDYLLKMMRSMRDRMELLREWQDTGTVPEDLADDYGHGADLYEVMADYPLEVVDQRGRNFTVVLTVGGPHIEIEAEGLGEATLRGYWAGIVPVTLSGDVFSWMLDYYIDRDERN